MLTILLISSLLISAYGIPLDGDESTPKILKEQPPVAVEESAPKQEIEQHQPLEGPIPDVGGGAPLPVDISGSPDANPDIQPGTSDLDTDATFWGWGYRRPYYYRSYYNPWRSWGRSWGWGPRWGYRSYYW